MDKQSITIINKVKAEAPTRVRRNKAKKQPIKTNNIINITTKIIITNQPTSEGSHQLKAA